MLSRIRLGTRRSGLAVLQAEMVAEELRTMLPGIEVEIVKVAAEGDEDQAADPIIWGKGAFVRTLEQKCINGDIDASVHSLKDLPLDLPTGLTIAAIPFRHDPRDALVTKGGIKLSELKSGASIGTSSERRAFQIKFLRRDLRIVSMRGNVDTRVRKVLEHGECDGVILSYAALKRLGLDHLVSEVFDTELVVPAPGQGAVAIECRENDVGLIEVFKTIDDPKARLETEIERLIAKRLGGSCRQPVGVSAHVIDGRVKVTAASFMNGCFAKVSIKDDLSSLDELVRNVLHQLKERSTCPA
ncbi:MAG: hydroxymethylbilane synthase [Candidatus Caldarchaeum sp.]